MVAIADKFGKASIDTDYAVATTVKTTRVIGGTVLECYDLSKFADDTPVYFITYKKTTDPITGEVNVTNQTGWKAIVNTGANTLTNLTLAPGYTDTGNAIGDFVECILTSHWGNELVDGILTHTNPDGTLKTSAVQAALNLPAGVPADYTVLATTPTAVVNNGQRSYTMTFPGVNYTDRLSPGMRLRTTRSVAAPTQSASLNGTTQYFSKTAPAGMTFTDDFVVSAWVKLDRYPTSDGNVISRQSTSGTVNGWRINIGSAGQIYFFGYNANNYRGFGSYQSIPLNKWVHITAQLDMSSYPTTSPTTTYLMIDGVDVPISMQQGGTPSTLVQAGNLEVGSANGGTVLFPGKIAQAAVFGAKVTQATMRGYMSQGLTGTEPSLVSAYSLSNSLEDLSANNNDLTANGGVLTTNADSPFGGQADGTISTTVDYGIVQKVTPTTITLQVPEGCTIPTSGGVASTSYSTARSPYGFPSSKNKWTVDVYINTGISASQTSNTINGFSSLNITVPTGAWELGFSVYVAILGATSAVTWFEGRIALSTANNTMSDSELIAGWEMAAVSSTVNEITATVTASKYITLASASQYYVTASQQNSAGASATLRVYGERAAFRIRCECAYL